jgi:hypothetical protein
MSLLKRTITWWDSAFLCGEFHPAPPNEGRPSIFYHCLFKGQTRSLTSGYGSSAEEADAFSLLLTPISLSSAIFHGFHSISD